MNQTLLWAGKVAPKIIHLLLVVIASCSLCLPIALRSDTALALSQQINGPGHTAKSSMISKSDNAILSSQASDNSLSSALSNTQTNLLASSDQFGGHNPLYTPKPMTIFDRSVYTARALQAASSENYSEYIPGCNKDYARSECFTATGDGAGARATNGHDLDISNTGYQQFGAYTKPRGYYQGKQAEELHANAYATAYPNGTYLMKRLRNLAFDSSGNGLDDVSAPLDDVHDFVYMTRKPKPSGAGFIWDVFFNMGGRTHGAANALNYFTVPLHQILDHGSEGGSQFIERMLYQGIEGGKQAIVYKHGPNKGKQRYDYENKPMFTKGYCRASWDNPNALCDAAGSDVRKFKQPEDSETLEDLWMRLNDGLLPQALVGLGGRGDLANGNAIGSCSNAVGFDCMHSKDYGFPDSAVHKIGPRVPGSKTKGFGKSYVHLIDGMHMAIRNDTQKIFTFVNKLSNTSNIPYKYHIHFTTTTEQGHENDNFYYAAGSYYGNRTAEGSYGLPDPYGYSENSRYSLKNAGRQDEAYRYSTLYQQWYGVPRILDVQTPPWQFVKGTGLGPYDSDDGRYLQKYGVKFSSILLGLVNEQLKNAPTVNAQQDITILPKNYSPANQYIRGNQWWRNPGKDNHNTADSVVNPRQSNKGTQYKLTLLYKNNQFGLSAKIPVRYRIIQQNKLFWPLQTQEVNEKQYRRLDETLPNPQTFIHFEDVKSKLYRQVKSLNPNLFLPTNEYQYGSVKNAHRFPLDESYKNSDEHGASRLIENALVHDVQWTDKYGSESRSHTLQDAQPSIAVKVPIESVKNPCEQSKILEDYWEEHGYDRDAGNPQENDMTGKPKIIHNQDRAPGQYCWPHHMPTTQRYVWYIQNAPQDAHYGSAIDQTQAIEQAKKHYRDYAGNMEQAELQPNKPLEAIPTVVMVKYAKVTFWDNSNTVIPVVFPYVDSEKPTLRVKVSINNSKPLSVPESGLKIPSGSSVKFFIQSHDDSRLFLGVKPEEESNHHGNDLALINQPSANGGGGLASLKYTTFLQNDGMKNTLQDQEGWLVNNDPKYEHSAQAPIVDSRDEGEHVVTFHAWDNAGNETKSKIKLIIMPENYSMPNVWWDRQDDGSYVGRVMVQQSDQRVRSLSVRIWARGKAAPVKQADKPLFVNKDDPNNHDVKCPTAGSCTGIMIQRDGAGKPWHMVNVPEANEKAVVDREDKSQISPKRLGLNSKKLLENNTEHNSIKKDAKTDKQSSLLKTLRVCLQNR